MDFLMLTLPNVLSILDGLINEKKSIEKDPKEDPQLEMRNSNFEIELLEYISLGIKRAGEIQKDEHMDEAIINCMKGSGVYEVLLKGITFTDTHYIKNLYIECSKEFSEMLARVDRSKTEITNFITRVLDKMFILLKNSDVNRV
jgi:hypothetical protein